MKHYIELVTKILLDPLKLSVKPHNSTPSISTEWTEVPYLSVTTSYVVTT